MLFSSLLPSDWISCLTSLFLKILVGIAHLPFPIISADGVEMRALMRSWSVGIIGGEVQCQSLLSPKKSSQRYILLILDWVPLKDQSHE